MDENAIARQVQADAREAMAKYGGTVEVRRPGHPLFGRRVTVKQVHLVYDKSLLPDLPNQRELIEETVQNLGVTPHFHHAR